MKKIDLKIYPMGGVDEIGSNMTVFETDKYFIAIDYGILFPSDDFFDINYLIVDLKSIKTEKEVILFITHGHEDHIGAVHHFVDKFPNAKIYAPNFARHLILKKLDRYGSFHKVHLYDESTVLDFDQFELHPVHVTHSIPDTFGVIFKDKINQLSVLFISDFKVDLNPLFEEPFNFKKLETHFGTSKMRLAMIDSTNILVEGKTLSESELTPDFEKIMKKNGRTFITMFSSNVYRLKNLLEIAHKEGRTITTIGRSINSYLDSAEEAKLINLEDYKIKDFDSIQNYNDPKLLLLVTGSQGEYLGATKRIVNGDQRHITLNESDTFVFSSKPIPGNEKKIYKLYNDLANKSVNIITFRDMTIHASGHPAKEDLKLLIENAKPTDYIPIHGETYFLKAHIDFIQSNFQNITTHFLQNFHGITFKDNKISYFEVQQLDPVLIHGNAIPIEREKISERRKIACNGLIVISINSKTKNILYQSKGLPAFFEEHKETITELVDYTVFTELKNRDYDYTCEQTRIKVRKLAHHVLGYKPITLISMV